MNPWWRQQGEPLSPPVRATPAAIVERRTVFGDLWRRVDRVTDRRALLLFGLRQVGKTVLLRQIVDQAIAGKFPPSRIVYVDFADPRASGVTLNDVVRACDLPPRGPLPLYLLDEVHASPDWPAWLKKLVDGKQARFVLADSAASLFRRGAVESALGRYDEVRIEPLSFAEFCRLRPGDPHASTLEAAQLTREYLIRGGFPEHIRNPQLTEVHRRIRDDLTSVAIHRDLASLSPRTDLRGVSRLFDLIARSSGDAFRVDRLARDLGVSRPTLTEWLHLLEQAHLVRRLARFSDSAWAAAKGYEKIYAADPGIVAAYAVPGLPVDADPALDRRVETAVMRHLQGAARRGGRIGYFRVRERVEADFALEQDGRRTVIEVTSASEVRKDKVHAVARAATAAKAHRAVLTSLSPQRRVERAGDVGVEIVPLWELLQELAGEP
jgi:hypothetical protein